MVCAGPRPSGVRRMRRFELLPGISLVDAELESGYEAPWHAHRDLHLTLVLRGRIKRVVGDAEADAGPLACTVFPRHVDHRIESASAARGGAEARIFHLWARPDAVPEGWRAEAAGVAGEGAAALGLLRLWLLAARARDRSAARRAARELLRRPCRERAEPAWLPQARRLIASRRVCGTGDLADALGLSSGHVARAFRAAEGVRVRDAVRAHRAARSVAALASGDGLADAAARGGFADQSHLGRELRRLLGVTPGELRNALFD